MTYDPEKCGALCRQCVYYGRRPMAPAGPVDSTFVVLDEQPTSRDVERGSVLRGPAGEVLDMALARAGLARAKVRVTCVVLCAATDDDEKAVNKEIKAANKVVVREYKQQAKSVESAIKRRNKEYARWVKKCDTLRAKHAALLAKMAASTTKLSARAAREKARIEKAGGVYEGEEAVLALPPPLVLPPEPPCLELVLPAGDPALQLTPTECCAPRLALELESAQTILMLGKRAMEAAMGREVAQLDEQGFPVVLSQGRNGVGIPHPAAVLHGMAKYAGALSLWVGRAVRQWRTGLVLLRDPSPFYTGWRVALVLREALTMAHERQACGARPLDVAIDVETDSLDVAFCTLRCVGIAFGDVTAVVAVHSITGEPLMDKVSMDRLRLLLLHPYVRKVFHNGMYDHPVLEHRVGRIEGPVVDTMLMHHLIESEVPHSLSFVSSLLLDGVSWKSLGDGTHGLSVKDDRQLWLYNSIDVSRTLRLVPPLEDMLEQDGLTGLNEITSKLLPIAARMGGRGMLINRETQARIRTRLVTEHARCVEEMHAILAKYGVDVATFDANKPSCRAAAWVALDIVKHLGKTPTGEIKATGDDLMRALPNVSDDARAFIGSKFGPTHNGSGYLGAQSTQKAISTFCDVEPSPDGRLRSSWKIHGAVTGRLSCEGPNLMNIPEWLREMYEAPEGYVYVAADYSALELWIVAIYTGAVNLLKALQSADVHRTNAEGLFGLNFAEKLAEAAAVGCNVHGNFELAEIMSLAHAADLYTAAHGEAAPEDKAIYAWLRTQLPDRHYVLVDAGKKFKCVWRSECSTCSEWAESAFDLMVTKLNKLRNQAKRYVYGANYGGGDTTIWLKLIIEFPTLRLEDVMFLSAQWKKVNPQIGARARANENLYHQRRLKHGVGWLESPILGRRRYWTAKDFGPTDAANFPIQSAGADIINIALVALNAEAERHGARLVAQVHDSLVYEVPVRQAEAVKHLLETKMRGPYKFRGIDGEWEFPVEAKIGKRWSEV